MSEPLLHSPVLTDAPCCSQKGPAPGKHSKKCPCETAHSTRVWKEAWKDPAGLGPGLFSTGGVPKADCGARFGSARSLRGARQASFLQGSHRSPSRQAEPLNYHVVTFTACPIPPLPIFGGSFPQPTRKKQSLSAAPPPAAWPSALTSVRPLIFKYPQR